MTKDSGHVTRRRFLSLAGVSGLGALAGCSDSDGTRSQTPTRTAGETVGTTEAQPNISSVYSDLQTAVDEVSKLDQKLLKLDEMHVISTPIRVRSNIKIESVGGGLQAAVGTSSDMLRTEDVSNVWIDGITIDGGWKGPDSDQNVGTRLIGGVNLGDVENLRVTNCTLRNSGLNAIELGEKEGHTIQDIYIGNNTITNTRNHGCLSWAKGNNGLVKNVLVENNTVKNTYDAQSIGVFGRHGSQYVTQCAFVNNLVDNRGFTDAVGANLVLEEKVKNSIIYGNTVLGNASSRRGGALISKDARHCIIGNNRIENCSRSTSVLRYDFYKPDGPPRHNLVTRNYVSNGLIGFYYHALDGDLHVSDNRFENVVTNIKDGGDNTGSNYTFYNNGPNVSVAGLPDSFEQSASYEDREGNALGTASWNRGSLDPSEPVSVSVTTTV